MSAEVHLWRLDSFSPHFYFWNRNRNFKILIELINPQTVASLQRLRLTVWKPQEFNLKSFWRETERMCHFPQRCYGDKAVAAQANAAVFRTSCFQTHGKWVQFSDGISWHQKVFDLRLWNRRCGRYLQLRPCKRLIILGPPLSNSGSLFTQVTAKLIFWMLTFTNISSCWDTVFMTHWSLCFSFWLRVFSQESPELIWNTNASC